MPLPEPGDTETREIFIERCMGHDGARNEFPDRGQRFAFCDARWENKGKKMASGFEDVTKADMPRTLFISRPVVNADDIITWAKAQGFKTVYPAEKMHVTVAFSRRPLDWFDLPDGLQTVRVPGGGPRAIQLLGENADVVVLRFNSNSLKHRHEEILEHGASWDWDSYKPHITLTLDPGDVDLDDVEPYNGEIILGLEKYAEVREDWMDSVTDKIEMSGRITKIDSDQRLAYGWFSVIEEKGKPVVDHHGDVILEKTLVDTAHKYVMDFRSAKAMHQGRKIGDLVESIVFTKEVRTALGINLGRVGWFGAIKVHDDKVWAKVKSGEYSEFSIGGVARRTAIKM